MTREEGPCTASEDRLRSQNSYMSQRSSGRPPRPLQSKPNPTTSPAQSTDVDASGPSDVSFDDNRPGQVAVASMGLPGTHTGSPTIESTPSRALGVHSILNPSHPGTDRERNPTSHYGLTLPSLSPRTAAPTAPERPSNYSPRSRKRTDPSSQSDDPRPLEPSRSNRRVLTPVSPGLRATSLGQRSNPAPYSSSGGSGPLPPHGEGRHFYTAEPGQSYDSDIPPLPIPSITARGGTSYRAGLESGTGSGRPLINLYGTALSAPPVLVRPSESPNTSQSSYSNISQTSPQYRYGAPQVPQSPYQSQQAPSSNYPPGSHASGISEAHYGIAQGQQYQMTLDTEHGPMTVPVELDLQQASKVADEKRKRNAGASARFRQRRKEKEKEASVTIASLEKDIKELEELRDFYYTERNFWRDFAARTVGAAQLPPRARSPAPRRQSIPMSSEGGSVLSQEQAQPEVQPTRAQRRRTGDYQPSFAGGQPSASPMLPPQHPPQQQPYPSQGGGPLPPMQNPYGEGRSALPGQLPPPPTLPPVSRSQSYDNLRPNNPYDRTWNPGR